MGGFATNLPIYTGKNFFCKKTDIYSPILTGTITCFNIGDALKDKNYFLSATFMLQQTCTGVS